MSMAGNLVDVPATASSGEEDDDPFGGMGSSRPSSSLGRGWGGEEGMCAAAWVLAPCVVQVAAGVPSAAVGTEPALVPVAPVLLVHRPEPGPWTPTLGLGDRPLVSKMATEGTRTLWALVAPHPAWGGTGSGEKHRSPPLTQKKSPSLTMVERTQTVLGNGATS